MVLIANTLFKNNFLSVSIQVLEFTLKQYSNNQKNKVINKEFIEELLFNNQSKKFINAIINQPKELSIEFSKFELMSVENPNYTLDKSFIEIFYYTQISNDIGRNKSITKCRELL